MQSIAREYTNMKARTENGTPVLQSSGGFPVVAFDAIAKLSGVSGGAVVKVLAALNLIAHHEYDKGADVHRGRSIPQMVAELADVENIPRAAANETRARNTQYYVEELAEQADPASEPGSMVNLGRITGVGMGSVSVDRS
jgi:hypothetical protein